MSLIPSGTTRIYMLVRTTASDNWPAKPEPEYRLRSDTAPLDSSKTWSAAVPIVPLNVNFYVSIPQEIGASCEIITLSPHRMTDYVLKVMKDKVGEAFVSVKNCRQIEFSWDEENEEAEQGKIDASASMRVGGIPGMVESEEHRAAWEITWVDVLTS